MDLKQTWCDEWNRIRLTEGKIHCRAFVSPVMNLQVQQKASYILAISVAILYMYIVLYIVLYCIIYCIFTLLPSTFVHK
jgi:hypothetical protein